MAKATSKQFQKLRTMLHTVKIKANILRLTIVQHPIWKSIFSWRFLLNTVKFVAGLVVTTLLLLLIASLMNFQENTDSIPSQKNLKTLVVIIGSVRGGELTWNSMYENLLEPNNADLALVVGQSKIKNSSMYHRAKYLYEFPEYDDWADALDLINGTAWRKTIYPYVNVTPTKVFWSFFLGGVGKIGGSGAIHFMARWFVQQMIIKEGLLQKYDRFIVTRSDHFYLCNSDLQKLDNRYVWVPKHEDYLGICDRHVIANSSAIMDVLNVLPHLFSHVERYKVKDRHLAYYDPEKFLRLFWRISGIWPSIKRYDRPMFTVAVGGDITRGKGGNFGRTLDEDIEKNKGLLIKYHTEFFAAKCHCRYGMAYSSRNWRDKNHDGWCLPNNYINRLYYGVE